MHPDKVLEQLRLFISDTLLQKQGEGLDAMTPLLAWHIVDSFGMMSLLMYIDEQFGIAVPPDEILPEHFETLQSLTNLVIRLAERSPETKEGLKQ